MTLAPPPDLLSLGDVIFEHDAVVLSLQARVVILVLVQTGSSLIHRKTEGGSRTNPTLLFLPRISPFFFLYNVLKILKPQLHFVLDPSSTKLVFMQSFAFKYLL